MVVSHLFLKPAGSHSRNHHAYMLYLIYFADGEHKTAHYAICTAFMALGMMIPGMAAGWLQEQMG